MYRRTCTGAVQAHICAGCGSQFRTASACFAPFAPEHKIIVLSLARFAAQGVGRGLEAFDSAHAWPVEVLRRKACVTDLRMTARPRFLQSNAVSAILVPGAWPAPVASSRCPLEEAPHPSLFQ